MLNTYLHLVVTGLLYCLKSSRPSLSPCLSSTDVSVLAPFGEFDLNIIQRNLHPRGVESDIFSLRFRYRSAHWRDSILNTVCDRVLDSDGAPDALWAR